MISREPTIERLATAQQLLLTPFGLDESHLSRALAEIKAYRVDDADLYFQYTRSEGWSLEEGIVKSGSFSIDQGVGVRAVAGEKTAFAYSDDISAASLMDAARTVRAIAAAGQSRRVKLQSKTKISTSRLLYGTGDPIATLDSTQKVALLERIEKMARARDPRVVQVMAGLATFGMDGIAELRLIPTAEGIQVIEQHRDAKSMRPIPLFRGHRFKCPGEAHTPSPSQGSHVSTGCGPLFSPGRRTLRSNLPAERTWPRQSSLTAGAV